MLVLAFASVSGFAQQDPILKDGGFENYQIGQDVDQITSWCDCNLINAESYEGIIPFVDGQEMVDRTMTTSEGEKALLMMTHGSGKFAAMTQRIIKKLKIGKEYSISMDMSFLKDLNIQNEESGSQFYSYSNPVYLEVYAATAYCDHLELLYTSPIIRQEEWLTYNFDFIPIERIRYLTFQVQYYGNETYNGHLLLDNVKVNTKQD